jgi:hypothetical protein
MEDERYFSTILDDLCTRWVYNQLHVLAALPLTKEPPVLIG